MAIRSKIFVRRAERDDLDTIVNWMEDPDFLEFLYGDPARAPKQIRERIVSMLGRTGGQAIPAGIYLLIDSEQYGSVGLLSLQNISWRNRSCSLDLYIGNRDLRNRLTAGVATFCALEYCFHELNLHRVSAYIYAFNEASWQVFEKVGAVRELHLRDHVARNGKLHDVYGYGLLRHEFEAFREQHPRLIEDMMASMIREYAQAAAKKVEAAS